MIFSEVNDPKQFKLKIIVLECPYNTYQDSAFTREHLSKIFKLKLDGYLSRYEYGFLPISGFDFLANHTTLCLEENGTYTPIMSYKSISKTTCDKFNIEFPVIEHMFGKYKNDFKPTVDAINEWQSALEAKNVDYAYNASWTIGPTMEKSLRNVCREMAMAIFYLYYSTYKIGNVINSVSVNHNVHKIQEAMGFDYLINNQGEKLDPFKSPAFQKEPFYIMFTQNMNYSEALIKESAKYKELWDDRLIIKKGEPLVMPKVA